MQASRERARLMVGNDLEVCANCFSATTRDSSGTPSVSSLRRRHSELRPTFRPRRLTLHPSRPSRSRRQVLGRDDCQGQGARRDGNHRRLASSPYQGLLTEGQRIRVSRFPSRGAAQHTLTSRLAASTTSGTSESLTSRAARPPSGVPRRTTSSASPSSRRTVSCPTSTRS